MGAAKTKVDLRQKLLDSLYEIVGALDPPNVHWAGGGDEGFNYCRDCCEKEVARLKAKNPDGDYFVDGGWGSEEDSVAFCEGCGCLLDYSLTDYGVKNELDHFETHGLGRSETEAFEMIRVIEGGGGDARHFPETVKTVRKIARKFFAKEQSS